MELSKKSIVITGAVLGLGAFGLYRIADADDGEKGVVILDASQAHSLPANSGTEAPGGQQSGTGAPAAAGAGTGTVRAEGRVATYPGGMVHVGAEVGGRIARLLVQEQQVVKRGTVIAEIASDEERAGLAEARARIKEADADITFLIIEQQRAEKLIQTNSIPKQGLDKATRDLESARARRAVAQATVQRIEAAISKMRIVAPIDGTVTSRYVEQGETIGAGTRVVTIADLGRRRVEAEIDEYDLGRVHIGDSVTIWSEGFEKERWAGKIEMIPDVVAQRKLEPNDPGRALDTRVLLIKVTLPPDSPLKLGQRVEIEIIPARR